MAIANYNELKEEIGRWLERSDLAPVIPTFIEMCEESLNNDLRHHSMQEKATVSLSSNVGTMPTDCLEIISAYADVNTRTRLHYREIDWLNANFPSGAESCAAYYGLEDGNILNYLADASNIYLTYYEKIPALTSSNTTNWVLSRAPSVYIFGSCLHAAPYLMDAERINEFGNLYSAAYKKLAGQSNRLKFSGAGMQFDGAAP